MCSDFDGIRLFVVCDRLNFFVIVGFDFFCSNGTNSRTSITQQFSNEFRFKRGKKPHTIVHFSFSISIFFYHSLKLIHNLYWQLVLVYRKSVVYFLLECVVVAPTPHTMLVVSPKYVKTCLSSHYCACDTRNATKINHSNWISVNKPNTRINCDVENAIESIAIKRFIYLESGKKNTFRFILRSTNHGLIFHPFDSQHGKWRDNNGYKCLLSVRIEHPY